MHGEVARNTSDSNAFYCDTDGISLLVASIEIDCAGILPNIVQLLFCTSPLCRDVSTQTFFADFQVSMLGPMSAITILHLLP